jgi:hypothetical protein
MGVVGVERQRAIEITQCLVVPAHARLQKPALAVSPGIVWISRNGNGELSDLSVEVAFEWVSCLVRYQLTTPA